MNQQSTSKYWKSPATRDRGVDAADIDWHGSDPSTWSRRQFLEAAGFSLVITASGGCGRAPTRTALPFVDSPEGVLPGQTLTYASTCAGCSAACGLQVGVRDGRPLKMEGLPEHPLSRGGLCAIGQALPLGLYDSHRLQQPLRNGQSTSWSDVDTAIANQLTRIAAEGGAVRFVTPTVTSPTLQEAIDSFLSQFRDARHITFDAISCSAILDAHEVTHGMRVLPHYQLDQSRVIVAFGADFLGTWISPVEFTTAWRSQRVPTSKQPEMSYHVQLEGRMSLSGSNADKRFRVAPDEYGPVLSHLANQLAELAGQFPLPGSLGSSPVPHDDLSELAKRLWAARGACVVLCDSQEVSVQIIVNYINHLLDNYGTTVNLDQASRQKQGRDGDVLQLMDELLAGEVSALFVSGTDLTHGLPNRESLATAIRKIPLVVSLAEREDDFSSLAHFVCPDHHALESWFDAEPVYGIFTLAQPTLQPVGDTRSAIESLARWSGRTDSAYDLVRHTWEHKILPRVGGASTASRWDQAVHDGLVVAPPIPSTQGKFLVDSLSTTLERPPRSESAYVLELYTKLALRDSRHAHNPWLQELPDPITKVTWDNYVCVSSHVATQLGLADGDLVRVQTTDRKVSVELPALVQPGQHDRVIAIALGYGVRGTDRFARIGPQWLEARPTVAPGELVGKNVASFIEPRHGTLQYTRSDVSIQKMSGRRALASTQEHHSLTIPRQIAPHGAEVRDQIQETTLAAFVKNASAGAPEKHPDNGLQLWPEDHPKSGHRWGMVIDLNACTGCSACLIACQSENNVPVVGKDEVHRQREMHWIRIDRYYSGEDDEVEVSHQPMMCHHCDNAPCETVCPVLATVHSDEGLNEQVYNRCVGTRYCANNCPYKVRRFNWFKYERGDVLQNLALNPDVTVRTRGVMEKCSLCVQRIEEGKIAARQLGVVVADGTIQTACQQSCPSRAIIFGDLNDPLSSVHAAMKDPRSYRVLEEFNFRPAVAYLRYVRNRDGAVVEDHTHA